MTPKIRQRGLLAWAHLYFLLTFRWWYQTLPSFSAEGFAELNALPVWGLSGLGRLPESVVALLLEALILLALVGAYSTFSEKGVERSRLLLWPLLIAKLYLYVLDLRLFTTYHHMHVLIVVLLALGSSRFLLQIALAQIYFFSALGKLNDSWLAGEYFHSIPDGLPLLGSSQILLLMASWAVIALEIIGPVLWFTPWLKVRRASLVCFLIFHLYSGFIVGFRYPILMLGLWYLVLWPLATPVQKNFVRKRSELLGGAVLLFTFLLAWWPYVIASDSRYTYEGRYFSIGNMFDANRQVRFEARFEKGGIPCHIQVFRSMPRHGFYDASTRVLWSENSQPFRHLTGPVMIGEVKMNPDYFREAHLRSIGDPYLYLSFLQRLQPENLNATLNSALNNGEDVRVFQLRGELPTYRPGSRNEWVHDE
jgi:hypothetical protein